jgi:hypothetical protein
LIGAGEPGQAVRIHDRHDQGIVAQKSGLPAQVRSRGDEGCRDGQNLDAALQHSFNGVLEPYQLLHRGRMLSQPPRNRRRGPVEGAGRLDGHDPVGHFGQYVRGREARYLLILDALEQLAAKRAIQRIRDEVVNEWVGIQKNRLPSNKVGEGHACSCGSNSTSSAKRRSVSWSLVHWIIPAVSVTQLFAVCTVTWTRACSLSGSGWTGLSTPFS